MTNHLKSNVARFPSETIEGETILIDSEKGVLLLLSGSARGSGIASPAAPIATRGRRPSPRRFGDAAAAEVAAFIDSMLAIGLLGPCHEVGADPTALPDAFTTPAMETFEDISEIIMMDPIHEVDPNAGWPNAGIPVIDPAMNDRGRTTDA